jgi:hypothetical protein
MWYPVHAIRTHLNTVLLTRGSSLEFMLHRLNFISLLKERDTTAALKYAQILGMKLPHFKILSLLLLTFPWILVIWDKFMVCQQWPRSNHIIECSFGVYVNIWKINCNHVTRSVCRHTQETTTATHGVPALRLYRGRELSLLCEGSIFICNVITVLLMPDSTRPCMIFYLHEDTIVFLN